MRQIPLRPLRIHSAHGEKLVPILLLIFAPYAGRAQQAPAVFRSETNLVVVNISVRDKSGHPIPNLNKEDFTVFENDKPQKLAVFEYERLNSEVLPEIADKPKTLIDRTGVTPAPQKPTAVKAAAAPVPASSALMKFQDKRMIGLFFDLASMQPQEQMRAIDAAVKFLETQMTASDVVAVMTYTNQFNLVQEFTGDRDLLIDTVRHFRVGESSEFATDAPTGADVDDDSGQFVADETEFNVFNTDQKLAALETAARRLAAFPEKKALVYFSSGITKTGMENQAQLRSTVNTAVKSNVAFYPVDARGLMAMAPGGDATKGGGGGGRGMASGSTQTSARASFDSQQETLYTLAADTGGKAMLDSNDLTMGIRQVQKDMESYYILGFYSSNGALDGKYRRIRVELNHNLQAKIDYKKGYYANKEFKKFTGTDKERQLQEALDLGDPVSELPLALEVDYFRMGRDRYFVPVSVKIPASIIGLKQKGSKQTTDLDFVVQVRQMPSEKLVSSMRDQVTVKLDESAASQLDRKHFQYDTVMDLPPGNYDIRVLCREDMSGKMGTFESKFVVPNLTGDSKKLLMSSVIWAGQREPVKAAVGSAQNDKKAIANHPLIRDGVKLVPSITRVFRRNQNLYVYFEVYDPNLNPTDKKPDIAADLVLFSGAKKAFESAPVRVTQLAEARSGVVPFQLQVPLSSLPAGRYTSQLTIIDELGRRFGFARTPLIVLP